MFGAKGCRCSCARTAHAYTHDSTRVPSCGERGTGRLPVAPKVCVEVPLGCVCLGADPDGALKGPLPRMGADVRGQVVLGRYRLVTEVAFPRLFASVHSQMPGARTLCRELLVAKTALIRLLPGVRAQVCDKRTLLTESFRAKGALVGPLPCVHKAVTEKILFLRETFLANFTLEGPIPRVNTQVSIEWALSEECLVAVRAC